MRKSGFNASLYRMKTKKAARVGPNKKHVHVYKPIFMQPVVIVPFFV